MTSPISNSGKYAAYFSHSWDHRDLKINLMLWAGLARRCQLWIDQPQPTREAERPYFISRIESLLRRADVFVCCLPTRALEKRLPLRKSATGDWRYNRCSPYILFELRLAERLNLPSFILYDHASGFRPPPLSQIPPHVVYVERYFDELQALIDARQQDSYFSSKLASWLKWLSENRLPAHRSTSSRAAYLLADDDHGRIVRRTVKKAVLEGGFDKPEPLETAFRTDAELFQVLRSLGLLVVDVGKADLIPLYHAAHSLLVPTIRLHSGKPTIDPSTDSFLPLILQGHPAGYQLDLLRGESPGQLLFDRVSDRAKAVDRSAQPVIGFESGRSLIYQRTYPRPHFVFISHNERLNDRVLVDAIVSECKERGINYWEYAVENRAGDEWHNKMTDALKKTTHMICLLSPTYEQSEGCEEERNYALERRHQVSIFDFLTRGRIETNFKTRKFKLHQEPLLKSPKKNALRVADILEDRLANPKT